MPNLSQAAENEAPKKRAPEAQSTTEPAGSSLEAASIESPLYSISQAQTAGLNDARIPLLQRQMMAGQVGNMHGNLHLQRVLADRERDESSSHLSPGLTTSHPHDPAEQEAQTVADRVLAGEAIDISQAAEADVQGDWITDTLDWIENRIGDVTDSRPDEARLDAEEELADFMREEYELENHHPDTGRGLFDAHYDPVAGDLTIISKICFNFENGDPTDPDWVNKIGGPVAAAAFPPEQFQWQPDEIEAWKTEAISMVESVWSEEYTFRTTRSYWEALPPVHVHIQVVEAPATGDDMAHYVVSIQKWPDDAGLSEGIVPPGADDEQSTGHLEESVKDGIENLDQEHFVRDTNTRAAYGVVATKNPGQLFFDQGSAEVRAADQTKLQEFGETLGEPQIPPFPITVTGHASSEGSDETNMTLSEDRARTVSNEIVSGGAKTQPTSEAEGEAGADETPVWRRVDIEVGDFVSDQTTVLHEFGHIFGLGDEYPTKDSPTSSRPPGTEVAHSDLAEELIPGQEPIVATHNENIMSNGEVIQPYHYVTFLEALGIMTDTTGDWEIGPGGSRGPGDFPIPDPDGPQTA